MTSALIPAWAEDSSDTHNVRRVKALYRALKAGDQSSLREILVEQPVWDVAPGFPDGGVYRGAAQVFGVFYKKLRARVHSFGAFPDRFVDGGTTVVALGHYHVTRNEGESPVRVRFCHAFRIDDDGRVAGVWQVADSAQFFAGPPLEHLPDERQ